MNTNKSGVALAAVIYAGRDNACVVPTRSHKSILNQMKKVVMDTNNTQAKHRENDTVFDFIRRIIGSLLLGVDTTNMRRDYRAKERSVRKSEKIQMLNEETRKKQKQTAYKKIRWMFRKIGYSIGGKWNIGGGGHGYYPHDCVVFSSEILEKSITIDWENNVYRLWVSNWLMGERSPYIDLGREFTLREPDFVSQDLEDIQRKVLEFTR